jgi:iron(III) transport system substrate-binding protein
MPKHLFHAVLVAALVSFVGPLGAAADDKLVVYTAFEEHEAKVFWDQFRKDLPALAARAQLVRGTDPVAERLAAERLNPSVDVLWGVPSGDLTAAANGRLVEPYLPDDFEAIPARFRHPEGAFVGLTVSATAFVVNRPMLSRLRIDPPRSWAELVSPRYKGLLLMQSPVESDVAYLVLAAQVARLGEERAFEYYRALAANAAAYVGPGVLPGRMVAAGEATIAVALAHDVAQQRKAGASIDVVYPFDGMPWTLEGVALVRSSRNPRNARAFLDWAVSPSAMAAYAKVRGTAITRSDVKLEGQRVTDLPLIPLDFAKAGADRERLVKRWAAEFAR